MIRSFRSKPLRIFAGTGKPPVWDGPTHKLPVARIAILKRQLTILNQAKKPEDMDFPGYRFHSLRGKPKRYAVDVTANWRLTFGWDDGHAMDVDLEDYH